MPEPPRRDPGTKCFAGLHFILLSCRLSTCAASESQRSMPTLIITVDLQCCRCSTKIQKILCCIQDRGEFVIEKIVYEKDKVLVSGPFDAEKLSCKLWCKAGKIIKNIEVVPDKKEEEKKEEKKKEEKKEEKKPEPKPAPCNLVPLPYPYPYPYPYQQYPSTCPPCGCPTPYCECHSKQPTCGCPEPPKPCPESCPEPKPCPEPCPKPKPCPEPCPEPKPCREPPTCGCPPYCCSCPPYPPPTCPTKSCPLVVVSVVCESPPYDACAVM